MERRLMERRARPHSAVDSTEDSILYVKQIGNGSYGEVWSAKWKGRLIAAKRLHSTLFRQDPDIIDHYTQEFKRESEVLQRLIHPNIIRFYTVLFPPNSSPVIVTELLHCDLQSYIENSTTTPKVLPDKVISISLGIAEGLVYLHGSNPPVVHRDLATKNILLTTEGHPKIADLGVAKVFKAGKDAFATIVPGTPLYAAPETYPIKKGLEFCTEVMYGVKVDIFSFGVLLLVMIVGEEPTVWPLSPLKAGNKGTLIPETERRKKDLIKMGNHKLKNLVLECIQDKSNKRPSASQIRKNILKIHQQLETSRNGSLSVTASRSNSDTERNPSSNISHNTDDNNSFEKVSSQLHYDYKFKVLLLGSSGVGKTCLVERLRNPAYNIASTTATLGIDPLSQAFKYNSSFVHMQITDTAGQERFFAIQPMYFRDVHGVFLVYDVMWEETFLSLESWLNLARQHCTESHLRVVLVGNKVDCICRGKKVERKISKERALEFAKEHGFSYIETSVLERNLGSLMNMYKKMIEILVEAVNLNNINVNITNSELAKDSRVDLYATEQRSKCRCRRSNAS